MATGPRVAFAMSRAGRLPAFFGTLTHREEAPAAAILSVAGASLAILWSGRFEQIIFAAGVGLALSSLLTISAVFVLRKARPDLPRPFRVPGYPVVPAVYLAFTTLALDVRLPRREPTPGIARRSRRHRRRIAGVSRLRAETIGKNDLVGCMKCTLRDPSTERCLPQP